MSFLKLYLGSWSASTSPARSPSPSRYPHGGGNHRRRNYLQNPAYGTTSLCQRSRSPSPARLLEIRERDRLADEMGTVFEEFHLFLNFIFYSNNNNNKIYFVPFRF